MASFNNPVDARMWGDGTFRLLSRAQPNAQTLWVYILTGPHNRGMPGLYAVGAGEMSEVLGWQAGDICGIAHELTAGDNPMLMADWSARVLFVPKVFRYRPPASIHNVSAWVKPFDAVPESGLKACWLQALGVHCAGRSAEFLTGFRRVFRDQIDDLLGCGGDDFESLLGADGAGDKYRASDQGSGAGADVDSNNAKGIPNAKDTSPASVPPEAVALTDLLAMLMVGNDSRAKYPAAGSALYGRWVSAVERIHRIDGRSWAEIEAAIRWSQADSFWKGNILSTEKLRAKMPTLLHQMGRRTGVSGRNAAEFQRAMGRKPGTEVT